MLQGWKRKNWIIRVKKTTRKSKKERFCLTEFFNSTPEETRIRGGSKTSKKLSFKRATVRKRLVTKGTAGKPMQRRIRQFSILEKEMTMFDLGKK